MCVCRGGGGGVGLLGCVCMYVCMSVHAHWEWEQGVLGERVSNLFLVLRLEAGGMSGIQGEASVTRIRTTRGQFQGRRLGLGGSEPCSQIWGVGLQPKCKGSLIVSFRQLG